MALLKPKSKKQKAQVKLSLDETFLEQVSDYCDWAGLNCKEDFFEEAGKFVFKKDKQWLQHLKKREAVS